MAITVDNRKRRVDAAGPLEPTDLWHGKTWYDYNTNLLKVYDAVNGVWISENSFTIRLLRTTDVNTASGGAIIP